MNVHDRGTMKWVSLMLPEHVEMLKEVFVEYKEKPILDEQKMTEIDRTLKYALKYQVTIEMTYYEDGDFLTLRGKLAEIDQWRGYIVLRNENGGHISLSNMIDVEVIAE
ncbi:MAG TPA: YolD-like family protein [Pseudogracilibacillus sp.]|nr:YolD-like family protein [Pseudogracilibacillus sp.]